MCVQNGTQNRHKSESQSMSTISTWKHLFNKRPRPSFWCSRLHEASIFTFPASAMKPWKNMPQGPPKPSKIGYKSFQEASKKKADKACQQISTNVTRRFQKGLQNDPPNRWKMVLEPSWEHLGSGSEPQGVWTPQNDPQSTPKWFQKC